MDAWFTVSVPGYRASTAEKEDLDATCRERRGAARTKGRPLSGARAVLPVPRWVWPVIALVVVAAACTGPARTGGEYRGKAATTVDVVHGSVESALVLIGATERHGLPAAYVSTAMAEAESDALAAESTLSSIQPPDGASDRVRTLSLSTIGDATDVLSSARITARRGELGDLVRYEAPLRRSARALAALSASLQAGA
ncbi:hypothetical protein [Aquihabitans sp. McL0605]|uniref:hypothetical protein n=1 Tax=Aquihabitans sp. McL0605 TaxID=3415671 RepID=UPI003CF927EB